jgi:hypothetical protein
VNWSSPGAIGHWANRDGRTRSADRSLEDVALRLAPIDADEARAMLDELKGHKLLPESGAARRSMVFDWRD